MNFRYICIDKAGSRVSGSVDADNRDLAMEMIRNSGLDIVSCKASSVFLSRFSLTTSSKLSAKDVVGIFMNIAELDRIGMPMTSVLGILRDDIATSGPMKAFANHLYKTVSIGKPLSEGFANKPSAIDPMYSRFVKVAETSGEYYSVFQKIIEYVKWIDNIRSTIKQTILKSSFALFFVISLMISMSTIVAPKIISFLTENGIQIPWYTQLFIDFSKFVISYWVFIVGGTVGLVLFFIFLVNSSPIVALTIAKLISKAPWIGELLSKIEAARFLTFFSVMYGSGSRIELILEKAADVVNNQYLRGQLKHVVSMVTQGAAVDDAIQRVKVFPRSVTKMISIGFKSGNIDDVFKNARYFLDREIGEQVDLLVSSVKPAMIVITGTFVAWMAVAIFSPIYSNIANFSDSTGPSRVEKVD